MKRSAAILALGLLACVPALGGCKQAREEPRPAIALAGRVTDAADLLTPTQESQLSQTLAAFEERTRHQMVVVTVRSLGGQDIAVFTRDLANAWGIGRRDDDDGIVVLVAPGERKARIAVGYGLEQALPHASCQQILDNDMIPRFRQQDYFGGIEAGTHALIARFP
ncbi:TPM domain-containing protein [Novosphingobium album (ex Liu et al. 2023)]|uniref:TPM domain-containing protein n=1 Tax=Novosphingobium album (ex Liu et al. 2023) TaxID=3031130 RepID=A0ABT5WSP7_9SPHN|nr:TPM domain-containing protein [Novosphingobium album (ex Liu et al. 2023)]MDE8653025.1 TPM domain-containing protein [Novosphingobium album (ex Liu et al. 2023)]